MSFLVSRAPFRVSFFGGGTDYPAWYLKNGGAVLSTAINKYCYLTCRYQPQYFPTQHRVVWSHIEVVQSISEILHPAVRAALLAHGFDDRVGVEIHHHGDLPARTGIGSSSSFAVSLILALKAMKGETIDKPALALAAIDLEQNKLRDAVGSQDQVASAYGGLNIIRFEQDGTIKVDPVLLSSERRDALESRLLLFYTGSNRLSSEHSKSIMENMEEKSERLTTMHKMVFEAANILKDGDLDDFGRMLDQTWQLKRGLSRSVSTSQIDEIYQTAIGAGALGGKLLGAGGAGFMAFYCPDGTQNQVRRALRNLICVELKIDREGASILYRSAEFTARVLELARA
ncbi:MAG TPA: kinase [Magnetospirillaceae bacterium]|jgi:D-glycero-alpha-D-manno-heptose-7-phosphate kinase